jgi:hypothetical protein
MYTFSFEQKIMSFSAEQNSTKEVLPLSHNIIGCNNILYYGTEGVVHSNLLKKCSLAFMHSTANINSFLQFINTISV